MELYGKRLVKVSTDLNLDKPFIKGQVNQVTNCWHFSTDGNAVDLLFYDEEDLRDGMNRVYKVSIHYDIIILAFCLMDTHVHFILHGDYDECNRFVHEFIRRTSIHIAYKHGDRNKTIRLPINHQHITDEIYLKTAICYVIKNPPVGGLSFNALDYPWSSGPLYFRKQGFWSSPFWIGHMAQSTRIGHMTKRQLRTGLKARETDFVKDAVFLNGMVFPGEYVAYQLVERMFKSCKSFNYFMSVTKQSDIESHGGTISTLSIPLREMMQNRNDMCRELFGKDTIRTLNTVQRIRLAKTLKSRYNSSSKQIIRICGLIFDEVKDMI